MFACYFTSLLKAKVFSIASLGSLPRLSGRKDSLPSALSSSLSLSTASDALAIERLIALLWRQEELWDFLSGGGYHPQVHLRPHLTKRTEEEG